MKTQSNHLVTTTIINQISKTMTTTRTFESFEQFLEHVYSRQNNGKFLSKANYMGYVKKIAQTLGCTEQHFLNAELEQLKKWRIQIQDKPLFSTYSKKFRSDLGSGFKAFINYCRYLLGLVSY